MAYRDLLIGVVSRVTGNGLRLATPAATWPPQAQGLATALVAAFPGVVIVLGMESVFRAMPPLTLAVLAQMYLSVAVILGVIGIPWTIIRLRQASPPPAVPVAVTDSDSVPSLGGSLFLRRLSPRLGTRLLVIATEDHYLRVTTALGEELILFRLSDAVAELDPALGQQVHRSYWVARQAVSSVERQGHRTTLVLVNGAKVPVSRTYVPLLRAAGWLSETATH